LDDFDFARYQSYALIFHGALDTKFGGFLFYVEFENRSGLVNILGVPDSDVSDQVKNYKDGSQPDPIRPEDDLQLVEVDPLDRQGLDGNLFLTFHSY
jgi:hypothetical protein